MIYNRKQPPLAAAHSATCVYMYDTLDTYCTKRGGLRRERTANTTNPNVRHRSKLGRDRERVEAPPKADHHQQADWGKNQEVVHYSQAVGPHHQQRLERHEAHKSPAVP